MGSSHRQPRPINVSKHAGWKRFPPPSLCQRGQGKFWGNACVCWQFPLGLTQPEALGIRQRVRPHVSLLSLFWCIVPHAAVCPPHSHLELFHIHYFISTSQHFWKVNVVIPILKMKKQRSKTSSKVPMFHRWQVAEPGLKLTICLAPKALAPSRRISCQLHQPFAFVRASCRKARTGWGWHPGNNDFSCQ